MLKDGNGVGRLTFGFRDRQGAVVEGKGLLEAVVLLRPPTRMNKVLADSRPARSPREYAPSARASTSRMRRDPPRSPRLAPPFWVDRVSGMCVGLPRGWGMMHTRQGSGLRDASNVLRNTLPDLESVDVWRVNLDETPYCLIRECSRTGGCRRRARPRRRRGRRRRPSVMARAPTIG